ncbi:phage baseplate assembly protein [Caulobacter soli]|uniref:phage baseplate assembly protein n=1 Tax=Caulobacter soli TaxID=2708539 RepID=UPI0013ED2556|nr:hypothetical protein [Caulobacter soli]
MADVVSLKIAGKSYEGWTSVSIDTGLDAMAGAFTIGLTERWPGQPDKWVINPGEACEVFIGGDKVMTAWIDRADYELEDKRHGVSIAGREKTGDLVDCAAIHAPSSWKNSKLEAIAAALAKPFGVKVSAKVSTGAAFSFALQQGETVFEAIDRMSRQRGVLGLTTVDGNLELTRPGQVKAGYILAEGVNIERIRFTNDVKDRFSQYILKGQAGGGDFLLGTTAHQPKAQAADPGVTRYRPTVIINHDASSAGTLADQAKWEATVRAARAQQVTVTVTGWRDPNGKPYVKDRLVPVDAPTVGVVGELLISAVKFTDGPNGQRTDLTLTRKEAFSLIALPAKKGKGKGVDPLINLQ